MSETWSLDVVPESWTLSGSGVTYTVRSVQTASYSTGAGGGVDILTLTRAFHGADPADVPGGDGQFLFVRTTGGETVGTYTKSGSTVTLDAEQPADGTHVAVTTVYQETPGGSVVSLGTSDGWKVADGAWVLSVLIHQHPHAALFLVDDETPIDGTATEVEFYLPGGGTTTQAVSSLAAAGLKVAFADVAGRTMYEPRVGLAWEQVEPLWGGEAVIDAASFQQYVAVNTSIASFAMRTTDPATKIVPVTAEAAEVDLQTYTPFLAPCQFVALHADGLVSELTPDGDGERAQLLATTYNGRNLRADTFWITGDPGATTNGPWYIPSGTVEVGATLRRPTDIGGVPIERIFGYSALWATNARETRAQIMVRRGLPDGPAPEYPLRYTDAMYMRSAGFPNEVGSSDGSIVATPSSTAASEANAGRAALDLVVDPTWLADQFAGGSAIKVEYADVDPDPEVADYKIVVSVDNLTIEISGVTGLESALAALTPQTRSIAGLNLTEDRTVSAVLAALGTGTPSSGTYLRGDGSWSAPSGSAVTGFGTGAEGDVIISSNTTVTSDVANGFKHYRNLTINTGVTLTVVGVIFVSGTLTVDGTISAAGSNATGTGGASGASGITSSLANGGGNGGTAAGTAGAPTSNPTNGAAVALGAAGGTGGTGTSGAGGVSGVVPTLTTTTEAAARSMTHWVECGVVLSRNAVPLMVSGGGRGGGGGGGDGTAGGGGGGGGGFVCIVANRIVGTGTITAKGGNGFSPAAGNRGGGGGGGGGFIAIRTTSTTLTPTLDVAGGTGGTGSGTGTNGGNGTGGATAVSLGVA